jgi:hypothetical protein
LLLLPLLLFVMVDDDRGKEHADADGPADAEDEDAGG